MQILDPLRRSRRLQAAAAVTGVAAVGLGLVPVLNARAQPAGPPGATVTVARGALVQSVAASGTIASNTYLLLNFKQAGRLASLEARIGDRVQPGQILARQDATDLEAALASAQANLNQAEAAYRAALDGPPAETVSVAAAARDQARKAEADARDALALARERATRDVNSAELGVASARQSLDAAVAFLNESVLPSNAQDVAFSESGVASAQTGLDDARRLYDERVLPGNDQDIALAAAQLDSARSQLTQAQRSLAESVIPTGEQDITAAEQSVATAEQSLADARRSLDEGVRPQNARDIVAAQAAVASAQNRLNAALAAQRLAPDQADADIAAAQITRDAAVRARDDQVSQLEHARKSAAESLASAEASYRQAQASYDALLVTAPTPPQIAAAKAAITDAQSRLDLQIEKNRQSLASFRGTETGGDDEVAQAQASVGTLQANIEAARADLETLMTTPKPEDVDATAASLEAARVSFEREKVAAELTVKNADSALTQAQGAVAAAEQALAAATSRAQQTLLQAKADVESANGELASANEALATAKTRAASSEQSAVDAITRADGSLAAATAQLAQTRTRVAANRQRAETAVSDAESSLKSAEQGVTQARARARGNVVSGETSIDQANAQLATSVASLDASRTRAVSSEQSARAQIESARAQLQQAMASLARTRTQAEASVAKAQSDADDAAAKARAAEADFAVQTAPKRPEDLASLDADVRAARASRDTAASNRELAILRAPAAGTVGAINSAGIGQWTPASGADGSSSTNQPFMILADLSDLIVKAPVAEADVADLAVGDESTFTVDPWPNDTFTAKLLTIARAGQTTQNVVGYEATFSVGRTTRQLLPGMTANLTIATDRHDDTLIAPSRAVRTTATGSSVTVWRNGRTEEIPVEVGLVNDNQTEILAGDVHEGDTLLVTGRR